MKSPTKPSPHKNKAHQFVCSPLKKLLKQKAVYKRKRAVEEDSGSDVSAKPTRKGDMNTKKKKNKPPDIIEVSSDSEQRGKCSRKVVFPASSAEISFTCSSDDSESSGSDSESEKTESGLYRSNIHGARQDLCGMVFLSEHLELMRLTPFSPLFDVLRATGSSKVMRACKKKDQAIKKVVNSYNRAEDAFMLGNEPVKLRGEDFQLILGVCDGSRSIESKLRRNHLAPWVLRVFSTEIALSRKKGVSFSLERGLIHTKIVEKIHSVGREDIEDVVRLLNCFMLAAVLIPNQNGSMCKDLAQLFEKYEDSCLYDWGELFVTRLVNQIKAQTKRVGGGAVILPYFVLEHSKLMKATYPNMFPRFQKWDMDAGNKFFATIKLDRLKGIRRKITPTSAERSLLAKLYTLRDKVRGKRKAQATSSVDSGSVTGTDTSDTVISSGGGEPPVDVKDEVVDTYSEDDACVEEVPETQSVEGMGTPVYNNPVAHDSPEVVARCGQGEEASRVDLSKKFGMVDLNDPLFITPQPNVSLVAEDKTDVVENEELFLDTPPNFNLDVDPSQTVVTETQVDRYMGQTNIVDHLENVTKVNAELTEELIQLRRSVELLGIAVTDRDTRIVALESEITVNREIANEKMVELNAEKDRLNERVVKLSADIERLLMENKTSSEAAHKKYEALVEANAVKAEQRVNVKDDVITQRDTRIEELERLLAMRDDNIRSLTNNVLKLQELSFADQDRIAALSKELLTHTEPTMTQILENPLVHKFADKIEELHSVSSEKRKLEKEKAAGDVLINQQQALINQLQHGSPVQSPAEMTTPDVVNGGPVCEGARPIRMMSMNEVICVDEDDKPEYMPRKNGLVQPSSLTKRIKERTNDNARVPKQMSPFAPYGAGAQTFRGESSRSKETELVSNTRLEELVFDNKFPAINKTPGVVRAEVSKAYATNGPDATLWKGKVLWSDVKVNETMAILKHEHVAITVINAYGDLVRKELKRRGRKTKTLIFTAKFLDIMKVRESPNRVRFFQEYVSDEMDAILEAEVLLFPLNPVFGTPMPPGQSKEWVLLKFVRVLGEWHLFNPRQGEVGPGGSSWKAEVQLVIDYMEGKIREHAAAKGVTHPLLRRTEVGKPEMKRCPQQITGAKDSGLIVINLIDKSLKREHNPAAVFTAEMSGRYRAKIVQCFTHQGGDRYPIS